MSDFRLAVATVLQHEGGFMNNPSDPGGATHYGISLRYLAQKGQPATVKDIVHLTQDEAVQIYYHDWWERYNYGAFSHQGLATKILDLAINMGSKQAHICLQRALRAVISPWPLEDGVLGPATWAAVKEADLEKLLPALKSEAAGFYRFLRKPEFEIGWLKRAYS